MPPPYLESSDRSDKNGHLLPGYRLGYATPLFAEKAGRDSTSRKRYSNENHSSETEYARIADLPVRLEGSTGGYREAVL